MTALVRDVVARASRRWREAGVQARSALAATALLAVVIAGAGAVLLMTLQHDLVQGIDSSNTAIAQGISAQVSADVFDASPGPEGQEDLESAIAEGAPRRAVVQVLDSTGSVVASSAEVAGEPPITTDLPSSGASDTSRIHVRFDDDAYRAIAVSSSVGGQAFTVVVAQSLGSVEDSLHIAEITLAVGLPLLLLVVALATSVFVGRSLRPVGAIRRTVERITERQLAERVPVPEGRDEVSRLARTMNAMLTRLEASAGAQRQFVADASHELRSPIATLQAAADIAASVPGSTTTAELAALVGGESRRLERLVSDLLLLARHDDDGVHLRAEEVDLDDLVDAEARRLRATSAVHVEVDLVAARVVGDPHALSRVLRNLSDNALTHAESRVQIRLQKAGDSAVLEVANDGPAIEPADADRVFGRFVRLEESRARDRGGSGLGLAIVRELVGAHRGTVAIVPQEQGARFRVVLPLLVLDDAGDALDGDDAFDGESGFDEPGAADGAAVVGHGAPRRPAGVPVRPDGSTRPRPDR